MRTKRPSSVLGLDLSLTRTAAVLLPTDWAGDWGDVRVLTSGASLPNDASEMMRNARIVHIVNDLDSFLDDTTVEAAFVEGYSFGNAQRAHQLGELRGVVRWHLVRRFQLAPKPVAPSSVRKLFFGAVPKERGDALKKHILSTVNALGAEFKSHDVADAFLVANYGLTDVSGGRAMSLQGVVVPQPASSTPAKRQTSKSPAAGRGRGRVVD